MRRTKPSFPDFLIFHGIFSAMCIGVLFTPIPRGFQLLILTLIYNIALPVTAYFRKHPTWLELWYFLFPLSVLMVFPDWWLSSYLKILVFPEDGLFKIGTVSAYMAGLWVIPLFILCYLGDWARIHLNKGLDIMVAGISGFMIFAISEATIWMLGSWYAFNVKMWGKMALYVLPAELILSIVTYQMFKQTRNQSIPFKIWNAFIVMLIYTGALNFFYFFIEH
jgi:hypothetical protein